MIFGLARKSLCGLCIRKQNSLWAEGDVFREKMLNERENGKMAVTRILSGVDDITINGSNKNRGSKKEEMEMVSLKLKSKVFHSNNSFCSLFFSFLCSTMMKRREMALHRVINYELLRARGRPDHPRVHYRKYPGSLQASSCITPLCCSTVK